MTQSNSRSGASLVKLVTLVLATPVVTCLVVSALVLMLRPILMPESAGLVLPMRPAAARPRPGRPASPTVKPKPTPKPTQPAPVDVKPQPKPVEPPKIVKTAPVAVPEPKPVEPKPVVKPTPPKPVAPEPVMEPVESQPAKEPVPVIREPVPEVVRPVRRPATAAGTPRPRSARFLPEKSEWMLEDFDQGTAAAWKAAAWGNPALLGTSEGALRIELLGGKKDKVAVGRTLNLDMTSRSSMVLDVMNGMRHNVRMAVAFISGPGSKFYETVPVRIRPGRNENVTFDLRAKTFKCAASDWKHVITLGNAKDVRRIYFLVYTASKGELFLDNIRELADTAGGPAPSPAP